MRSPAAGAVATAILLTGCSTSAPPATTTTPTAATSTSGRPSAVSSTSRSTAGSHSMTSSTAPVSSPAPTSATHSTTTPAGFQVQVDPIYEARKARMIAAGSWNTNCSVAFDDLRLVRLSYWGFDDQSHTGELVLNADAVDAVVAAMRQIYQARFPIRRMVTVEEYGADDETSMRADNTSAYNGRFVEGTTTCSQHAYGRAIDINPLENPMVKDGRVYPATAGDYVDRNQDVTGMIQPGDVVVRAFADVGWPWGGDWHSLKDWQHFSATGR